MEQMLKEENEKIREYRRTIQRKTCSTAELAEALEISEAKAKQLTRIEGFPKIKFGRNVRIILDRLDDWLDDHIGECL